jgi:GTP-binding protein
MPKINRCSFLYCVVDPKCLKSEPHPQIAFAGRSNVGKSSLLNAIAGIRGVAKVSKTPGKTRAINFFATDAGFLLVDLPGYGFAKVSKSVREEWGKLVEKYLTKTDWLAGVVHLIDSRHAPTSLDIELNDWLRERGLSYCIALTKVDKLSGNELAKNLAHAKQRLTLHERGALIPFSVKTGLGKKELMSWISARVKNALEESCRIEQ